MGMINEMRLDFPAIPENESFARMVISGFILPLNPTMEELADVKTAVSEAVTATARGGGRCACMRAARTMVRWWWISSTGAGAFPT